MTAQHQPDPDPLTAFDVDRAYEDGFVAGVNEGLARARQRDQLGAIALGVMIVVLLVVAFIAGQQTAAAASRSGPQPPASTGRAPAEAQIGAPLVPRAPEPETARVEPSSEGPLVLSPMTGGAPPSPDVEIGTAIASGTIAYAVPSFGSRYLAIPEGPGHRVRICVDERCLARTSTDAGPDLAMQREGRLADLSYVDFRYLCGCRPESIGLIVGTIEYLGPTVTPPATETEP